MLNKQGKNKIDWTDFSWNPIGGCLHDCEYCYLKRMSKRFGTSMMPAWRPGYLADPHRIKEPSRFFVGSSGDMWGHWVERGHIQAVLESCAQAPRHTFQFLTKNPKRYREFPPIANAWYGTTVDGTERTKNNIADLIGSVKGDFVRFVSFEPLLGPVSPDLTGISWIIIGANSNPGAVKPPDMWADDLVCRAWGHGAVVFIKDNYKYPNVIKEFPSTPERTLFDN